MKCCPYCGTEYPDEVAVCPIDQQPLQGTTGTDKVLEVAAAEAALSPTQPELPQKITPELAWPEYRWSAKAAFKCMGMMFIMDYLVAFILVAPQLHFPRFGVWRSTGFGSFSSSLLFYLGELFAAIYFARTDSFSTFCKAMGLDRKPTELAWFGVVGALTIRFIGHLVLIFHWSRGITVHDIAAFKSAGGHERYLYLGPLLLLAPLFEESMYRGFLYKAFRGTWPVGISMALIVGWTTYTHWAYYSVSWIAAFDLSALTILQCYLREKSDSLWDCIICHAAFNWTLIFLDFH
jgi:membrane protease YdiL (CAAX protease family)